MARRLNFTGRHKINQSDVTIRLRDGDGGLRFDADLTLGGYKLAADATVHVEVYRSVSTLWKRFDFGRVSALTPPPNRSLTEFEYPEGILFRVKVASAGETAGRLLAEADRVRPLLPDETQAGLAPLLNTDRAQLGATPWRVSFEGELPCLLINETVGDWKGLAQDPVFRALVAPEAMRSVLRQILIINQDDGDEEDATDWRTKWLAFAESLPGVGKHELPEEGAADFQTQEDWIQDTVDSFCRRATLLPRLIDWHNRAE